MLINTLKSKIHVTDFHARAIRCTAVGAIALFGAVSSIAQPTGYIESKEGFVDAESGARVEAVDKSFWTGKTRVLVSVPATNGSPGIEVEEVLVTAKRPDEPDLELPLKYEFVNDYSNDRYGMYIYLGKGETMPFRIYFKDTASDVILNRAP